MFNPEIWQYVILGYGTLALIWLFTIIIFYEILKRVKRKKPTKHQLRSYSEDASLKAECNKYEYRQFHKENKQALNSVFDHSETLDNELEEEHDFIIIEENE